MKRANRYFIRIIRREQCFGSREGVTYLFLEVFDKSSRFNWEMIR